MQQLRIQWQTLLWNQRQFYGNNKWHHHTRTSSWDILKDNSLIRFIWNHIGGCVSSTILTCSGVMVMKNSMILLNKLNLSTTLLHLPVKPWMNNTYVLILSHVLKGNTLWLTSFVNQRIVINTFFLPCSCHPRHCCINIAFSLAIRIRRICIQKSSFDLRTHVLAQYRRRRE